ncbi:MAG: pseG [Chitinophagaceae bacterium]|nr:pseG [Chitinophagaceae bacterium]
MTPTVFFRADGNTSIGLGHLVRCMALADMLREHFPIVFVTLSAEPKIVSMLQQAAQEVMVLKSADHPEQDFLNRLQPKDIVVLDGYHFTENNQKDIKNKGAQLVCIDDLNEGIFFADVIINTAQRAVDMHYKTKGNCRLLLGPSYALLRKPFLEEARKERISQAVSTVFINMGGGDAHNITLKALKAASQLTTIRTIHVVTGAAYLYREVLHEVMAESSGRIVLHEDISASEVRDLLVASQVIICPSSGIALEAASVGLVILSGYTAANQLEALKGLEAANIILNMGDLIQLKEEGFVRHLMEIVNGSVNNAAFIAAQKQLIDGLSGDRILKVFQEL